MAHHARDEERDGKEGDLQRQKLLRRTVDQDIAHSAKAKRQQRYIYSPLVPAVAFKANNETEQV